MPAMMEHTMKVSPGDGIGENTFQVLWPTAWGQFLIRMQLADEFIGRISVWETNTPTFLIVECDASDDRIILDACVSLNRPPAF
jgi:hypothetical protein